MATWVTSLSDTDFSVDILFGGFSVINIRSSVRTTNLNT